MYRHRCPVPEEEPARKNYNSDNVCAEPDDNIFLCHHTHKQQNDGDSVDESEQTHR